MAARELLSSDLLQLFPPGTVLHNPVTGEYARVVEHTTERVVGELLAVPGHPRAAIVPAARWPHLGDPGTAASL